VKGPDIDRPPGKVVVDGLADPDRSPRIDPLILNNRSSTCKALPDDRSLSRALVRR